jgi:protein-tyrosine-phosphatase
MPAPGHVLVVCTANICRSPMAAALLRHALAGQPEPLRSIPVISAGTSARTGEPVTDLSAASLKKVGLDISGHRSQPVTGELLTGALAVICMTESHRASIAASARPVPANLWLFRQFLPPGADPEIPDPYGSPLRVYDTCRDEMVEALPSLVQALRKLVA